MVFLDDVARKIAPHPAKKVLQTVKFQIAIINRLLKSNHYIPRETPIIPLTYKLKKLLPEAEMRGACV